LINQQLSDSMWLGYPDSNQEKQDQNLLCYHYTISQSPAKTPSLHLRLQIYCFFGSRPNEIGFFLPYSLIFSLFATDWTN
jgi:hypothetical protein